MKRTIFALATILVVFVALFAVLVLRPVPKVKAHHHGCSEATLNGNYGWMGSGWWYTGGMLQPVSLVGQATFNGRGGVSGQFDVVLAGVSVNPGYATFSGASYSVSEGCVFTASGITFESAALTSNGTVVDATGGSEVIADLESSGTNFTMTVEVKKIQGED